MTTAKSLIADALTFFRFFGSFACGIFILTGRWKSALILIAPVAGSDAIDGRAARRWPPKERWYRKNPHEFDMAADGAVAVVLPGALMIRFIVGSRRGWHDRALEKHWIAFCATTGVLTVICNWLKARLVSKNAETVEVAQGYLATIIFLAVVVQITDIIVGGSKVGRMIYGCVYVVTTFVVGWLIRDRLNVRPEVQYKGKKTFSTLFSE